MNNLTLFIISLLLPYSLLFSQQNVDINEGFEGTWLPGGWQSVSFSENSSTNHTSSGSKSASHGISIFSTASITSQQFQVTAGEYLDTISFWVRHSSISLSGSISVDITGSSVNDNLGTINLGIVPNNTWTKYTYSYSATGNDSVTVKLSVSHTLALGTMYVDDIRIHKSLVMPVEISYFNYLVKNNNITLSWQTVWEINNSGFEIERASVNSQQTEWKKIAFVPGNGTSAEPLNYTFTDSRLTSGKYTYRIKQIDYNSNYEFFNLNSDILIGAPGEYALEQNYPNPANPGSKINYMIPADAYISIKVYDVTGKEVKTLLDGYMPAGYHSVDFNGSDLASGIYFYKIISADFSQVKKMILIK